ncbi:MAG TPA: hypothetical protein VF607_15990 [Verrucomicrobiae bacterium]
MSAQSHSITSRTADLDWQKWGAELDQFGGACLKAILNPTAFPAIASMMPNK